MATVYKTSNGKWRAQVNFTSADGKKVRKSFTAQSKREAERLAKDYEINLAGKELAGLTVEECIDKYIEKKTGVLSPSTLLNYKKYKVFYPQWLKEKPINKLTDDDLDNFIKEKIDKYSAKTIKNRFSLLSSCLKNSGYEMGEYNMPKVKKGKYYVPSTEEVKQLISYAESIDDMDLKLGVMFGAYVGLRRGEICGLHVEDISDGRAHIHTDLIRSENGYVYGATKNETSDRFVTIPDNVLKELPKSGKIINCTPHALTVKFDRAHDKLGCDEHFTLHSLRHYYASVCHALGIPDQYIQKAGGWKTDNCLKAIYRNTMDEYEKKFNDMSKNFFENL